MSVTYSTGELARLAKVSVRTVQYYDKCGILPPTSLSEGGRRIYTKSDLHVLKQICFLRELDFSIEQIKRLLAEDNATETLQLLLMDHITHLNQDIHHKKEQVDIAVNLLDSLKKQPEMPLEQWADLSLVMKNHSLWRKNFVSSWVKLALLTFLFIGVVYVLGYYFEGQLWAQVLGVSLALLFLLVLIWMVYRYYQKVAYLCPHCHKPFVPTFRAFSLAAHTPKTRRLTCPHCHHKSYCLEIAREDEAK
ncbi:MerR family transcriptional regulator [Streptococcus hyointestinalis]